MGSSDIFDACGGFVDFGGADLHTAREVTPEKDLIYLEV